MAVDQGRAIVTAVQGKVVAVLGKATVVRGKVTGIVDQGRAAAVQGTIRKIHRADLVVAAVEVANSLVAVAVAVAVRGRAMAVVEWPSSKPPARERCKAGSFEQVSRRTEVDPVGNNDPTWWISEGLFFFFGFPWVVDGTRERRVREKQRRGGVSAGEQRGGVMWSKERKKNNNKGRGREKEMKKIKRGGSLPIPGQVEETLGKPGTARVAAAAVVPAAAATEDTVNFLLFSK